LILFFSYLNDARSNTHQNMVLYIAVVFISAGIGFSLDIIQEFHVIFLAGHQKGNATQVSGDMLTWMYLMIRKWDFPKPRAKLEHAGPWRRCIWICSQGL